MCRPEPKYTSKQPVGTAEVRVPTDCIKMDDATLPHIRADTTESGYAQSLGKNGTDSATIELPIMQSVYESKGLQGIRQWRTRTARQHLCVSPA